MKRSPLHRRSAPLRRTPFRVRARAQADTVPARKRSGLDAARRESFGRSGGLCVLCVKVHDRHRVAEHAHHRKLRSQGGTDEAVNLLPVCDACHRMIHENPEWAKQYGYIVSRWDVVTPWWDLEFWTQRRAS